jgi:hypothetical protein
MRTTVVVSGLSQASLTSLVHDGKSVHKKYHEDENTNTMRIENPISMPLDSVIGQHLDASS